MKKFINEQNTILLSASALFAYFQVAVSFISLLMAVMLIDFLTGITKEVVLSNDLSIQAFWVWLLKKITLVCVEQDLVIIALGVSYVMA